MIKANLVIMALMIALLPNLYAEPAPLQLYHFNIHTKNWDNYAVPGLYHVDDIVTAGKLAWAVNKNQATVGFFDGIHWAVSSIPGMAGIEQLSPAFPWSAKQKSAWAIGSNQDNKAVVSFFDGNRWRQAELIFDESNHSQLNNYTLQASAGYAWLKTSYLAEDGKFKVQLKVTSSQNPQQWQEINLPDSAHVSAAVAIANDDSGYLFWLNYDTLLRIDGQGNVVVVRDNLPWKMYSLLTAANQSVLLSVSDLSLDNGNTWLTLPQEDNILNIPSNDEFQGEVLCTSLSNSPFGVSYACLDTNHSLAWQRFDLPAQQDNIIGYTPIADINGEWITIFSSNAQHGIYPTVYHYDVAEDRLLDTEIKPLIATNEKNSWLNEWHMRAISPHEILTCGKDIRLHWAAFYYNGKRWLSFPLAGINTACGMSNTVNYSKYINNANVWIYPTEITVNPMAKHLQIAQ